MENGEERAAKVAMRVAAIVDAGAVGTYNLVLQEDGGPRRIMMAIGLSEAQSIAVTLEHVALPRPLTHDLMAMMIDAFGGEVHEIVIEELRDGYFISSIVCGHNERTKVFDSRTSDAVALALRCKAPIYIREGVLEMVSSTMPKGVVKERKEASIEEATEADLQARMERAIASEDYETAQVIKNELSKRKGATE